MLFTLLTDIIMNVKLFLTALLDSICQLKKYALCGMVAMTTPYYGIFAISSCRTQYCNLI